MGETGGEEVEERKKERKKERGEAGEEQDPHSCCVYRWLFSV